MMIASRGRPPVAAITVAAGDGGACAIGAAVAGATVAAATLGAGASGSSDASGIAAASGSRRAGMSAGAAGGAVASAVCGLRSGDHSHSAAAMTQHPRPRRKSSAKAGERLRRRDFRRVGTLTGYSPSARRVIHG